jgi:hypothetical protein
MSDQPSASPPDDSDRARPDRPTAADRRVQETVIISKDLISQAKADPTAGADQEFSTLSPTASNALFGATLTVVAVIVVVMVVASILAFFLFLR